MVCVPFTQRPHGSVRWSLPAGVSETRPTTNRMNLPPRTHKHAVWLARACTGIWFDRLTLPPNLQKLNIAQLLKWSDAPTMQFGKAWRHPIQSEWAEALKLRCTPPCGRAVSLYYLVEVIVLTLDYEPLGSFKNSFNGKDWPSSWSYLMSSQQLLSRLQRAVSRLQRAVSRLPIQERRHAGGHGAEAARGGSLPRETEAGVWGERRPATGQEETLHRLSRLPRLHDRRGHR